MNDDARDLSAGNAHNLPDTLSKPVDDGSANGSTPAERVDVLERLLGEDVCRRLGIYRLPAGFVLSVVMPVYNEARTVERIVDRVRACGLPVQIVLVDDGSTDGTREVLERLKEQPDLTVVFHDKNRGKGAAIRTGFTHATGTLVVIQDADLEYDPQDFRLLIQPILEDRADVVYGSRYSVLEGAVQPFWHRSANRLITTCANLATGLRFTDVETCYKMFRRELIQELAPKLREQRFGIELELTAKLARTKGVRFYERPISYNRRWYDEGKKIGWKDGLRAFWCIARYWLAN